jgi:hypothetical protein
MEGVERNGHNCDEDEPKYCGHHGVVQTEGKAACDPSRLSTSFTFDQVHQASESLKLAVNSVDNITNISSEMCTICKCYKMRLFRQLSVRVDQPCIRMIHAFNLSSSSLVSIITRIIILCYIGKKVINLNY